MKLMHAVFVTALSAAACCALAAEDEATLKEECRAEAASQGTPEEEFDAYVEACVADLKKSLATGGSTRPPQKPAKTAD